MEVSEFEFLSFVPLGRTVKHHKIEKRCPDTVSVWKGFGSKGKQHHKHAASETQSHNKRSN